MKSKPLISIIVPVYNSERYLSECISSILAQDYRNIELIIVNDGSTDNSLCIAQQIAENDSRVKILSKKNSGVSAARNLGISVSQGEYIGFVDSDDTVHKKLYQELVSIIINDETDMAALTSYVVRSSPKIWSNNSVVSFELALSKLFMFNFPTSLWAYLYKAETIKTLSLAEDIHFFEDFLFNFQALLRAKNVSVVTNSFYFYRAHDDSANSQGATLKRLTCLSVVGSVRKILLQNNHLAFLKNNLIFLDSHFLVAVLDPLKFRDISYNHQYVSCVKSILAKNYTRIIFNKTVPFNYKLYLSAARINIRFFIFSLFCYRFLSFLKLVLFKSKSEQARV